jgi:hypothetical protein
MFDFAAHLHNLQLVVLTGTCIFLAVKNVLDANKHRDKQLEETEEPNQELAELRKQLAEQRRMAEERAREAEDAKAAARKAARLASNSKVLPDDLEQYAVMTDEEIYGASTEPRKEKNAQESGSDSE